MSTTTHRPPLSARLWLASCLGLIAALFVTAPVYAGGKSKMSEDAWLKLYAKEKARRKTPRRNVSSAETVSKIPGPPVVPQMKSERKRTPPPDRLIGKVVWGLDASAGGDSEGLSDWNLEENDCLGLVKKLKDSPIQLSQMWQKVRLDEFDYSPQTVKSLFFSGVRRIRFDDRTAARLRQYVLDGGFIVFDSIAGSEYFGESARQLGLQMFPESRWRRVPPDHPLYHVVYDTESAAFGRNAPGTKPVHEAMYVGSRVGLLLSSYGMGPGWADNDVTNELTEAVYYDKDTAAKLGINLAAYVVGYAEAARIEGQPEVYGHVDALRPTDEFVFAQIKHSGSWNVHPGSSKNLLLAMARHTAIRVNTKRVAVTLGKDDLAGYPFLYLTGLDDFSLSDKEAAALRKFLDSGGRLLINNGLGLSAFHQAVLRELPKALNGAELKPILPTHPALNALPDNSAQTVEYSPVVALKHPELGDKPALLGVWFGKELRVIYSPYDLEGGWLAVDFPLFRGYAPESASRLGMNIIAYVMTQ